MRIAIVGTNSLFRSGASSFILHLGYNAKDWHIMLFNKDGRQMPGDIPGNGIGVFYSYWSDKGAKILEDFDAVLFAAPRWQGGYDFLRGLNLKKVGMVVHDHLDFERMGMSELLELFPNAVTFCMYSTVEKKLKKPVRIKHPFSRQLLPQEASYARDRFICMSRFSPSKHHEIIARTVGGRYPLHFYGVDGYPLFAIPNTHIHKNIYTAFDAAEAYSRAIAHLDATDLKRKYDAPQYTTLESWNYGAVPMVTEDFLCDEVSDGVSCLKLTEDNVAKIYHDKRLQSKIGIAGKHMLTKHDPQKIRNTILECLL